MKHKFYRSIQKGFTILELVVYIALLSMVLIALLQSMSMTMRAFSNLRISRDINDSAIKAMERMTRDIKNASSVNMTESTFGAEPSRLTINTYDTSGNPLLVEYFATSSSLHVREDGVDMGALLSAKTELEALVFYYVSTGTSEGVKIELHLRSTRGGTTDNDHFYNTVMLRGAY